MDKDDYLAAEAEKANQSYLDWKVGANEPMPILKQTMGEDFGIFFEDEDTDPPDDAEPPESDEPIEHFEKHEAPEGSPF